MTQITISEFKKLTGKKRNKYNAETCEYRGRKYDSKEEMNYAIKLDWLKRAERIVSWEHHVNIKIEIAGQFICNYEIDFKVTYPDRVEYVEVKGYETDLWKLKWKLAKALYPNYNFVLIKG